MTKMSKLVVKTEDIKKNELSFIVSTWVINLVKEINRKSFKKYTESDLLIKRSNESVGPVYKAYLVISRNGRYAVVQDLEDGVWNVVDTKLFLRTEELTAITIKGE